MIRWMQLEMLSQDRGSWREIVGGLCSRRSNEQKEEDKSLPGLQRGKGSHPRVIKEQQQPCANVAKLIIH